MEGGSVKIPFWPNQVWAESLQQRAAYSALFFLLFLNSRRVGAVEVPTLACYKTRKLLENRKDPPVRASGLNWALSACIAKECDFDGSRVGLRPELRRPPSPTVHSHSVQISPKCIPFGPAGTQPSKHRLDVILPPFIHNARLGDSNPSLLPTHAVFHTPAPGSLSGAFHHCGSTNQGPPGVCQ